jgi:ectoine hydroxylase-related dioxygenase (phytanoyl-CoA dioxygenase family)
MLSAEEKIRFERDGFLIIPNFFDPSELKQRAKELIDEFDPKQHEITKFTTSDDNHVGNRYFLESGDKVRYFFEDRKELQPTYINKIGHAIHELDPVFKKFSTSQKVIDVAKSLEFKDCRILQSMLIFKQPGVGGIVPGHIDSTFLYTDPPSAMGLWFALEDCTETNGCMWFVPGSHKQYQLSKRFVRTSDSSTAMVQIPGNHSEPHPDEYIPAPVTSGSLVLIHGLVYHRSGENRSEKSRWIYTFHMIEGENEYPRNNWLQPTPSMPFTKLY